ncbi:MAG: hypothetical protein ABIT37_22815 [Luteolibacter sp.]
MKPLPAQFPDISRTGSTAMPSLPTVLAPATGSYSKSNRRAAVSTSQRLYPWLLCASTGLAALFCVMYITKPIIVAGSNTDAAAPITISAEKPMAAKASAAVSNNSLMPSSNQLPGEKASTPSNFRPTAANPRQLPSSSSPNAAFEETNLRIQHILTAEAPGGSLARIDIEVPVLYQSRNLRWTFSEVTEARTLLVRLSDYQEKSRMLRAEGIQLLDSWNHLVEHSIPSGELRADSPTLPINQQDAADAPRPAGLSSSESIQIQPAGK